jgi:hypothetical protein
MCIILVCEVCSWHWSHSNLDESVYPKSPVNRLINHYCVRVCDNGNAGRDFTKRDSLRGIGIEP